MFQAKFMEYNESTRTVSGTITTSVTLFIYLTTSYHMHCLYSIELIWMIEKDMAKSHFKAPHQHLHEGCNENHENIGQDKQYLIKLDFREKES